MKLLRAHIWWNAVVPQVLGWIYFCALTGNFSFTRDWQKVIFFFVSLICISAFGYLFNDYCDQESDRISGKENSLSNLPYWLRPAIVVGSLSVGIISWLLVHANAEASLLFAVQIIALGVYSIPPIRLKGRSVAGIFTDTFYGHLNPVLIVLFTFNFIGNLTPPKLFLITVIFICLLLKGLRNIILHQIHDRKKDKISGILTFVRKNGALYSILLVNRLLPVEMLFTLLLAILISTYYPSFFLSILLFAIITYLKFSGWKLAYLPKRQLKFKFLYFLNDYYENWIPVFFLLMLCIGQKQLYFLLLLHLILFPGFVTRLWSDLKMVRRNFETEEDY